MISKDDIKQHLFNALKDGRFLWSYDNAKMRADDLSPLGVASGYVELKASLQTCKNNCKNKKMIT